MIINTSLTPSWRGIFADVFAKWPVAFSSIEYLVPSTRYYLYRWYPLELRHPRGKRLLVPEGQPSSVAESNIIPSGKKYLTVSWQNYPKPTSLTGGGKSLVYARSKINHCWATQSVLTEWLRSLIVKDKELSHLVSVGSVSQWFIICKQTIPYYSRSRQQSHRRAKNPCLVEKDKLPSHSALSHSEWLSGLPLINNLSLVTKPDFIETASFYTDASEEVRLHGQIYASCTACGWGLLSTRQVKVILRSNNAKKQ